MNIRKADSKGRLTGFEPDTYYWTFEQDNLLVSLAVDKPKPENALVRLSPETVRELAKLMETRMERS